LPARPRQVGLGAGAFIGAVMDKAALQAGS
jgi:hypothetical protein